MTPADYDIVVPTVGRPSLWELLASIARQSNPPGGVIVVDDRPRTARDSTPLGNESIEELEAMAVFVPGKSAGPASARNVGWKISGAPWIVFLDDDVVLPDDWSDRLAEDLSRASNRVAGVQGRILVPLARHKHTDWARNVKGLETAAWATADIAYRRSALTATGGFDERFRRAYREDSDLALRTMELGYELVRGSRRANHPVPPAGRWTSVRLQAGNADDVLMWAIHGPRWRALVGAPEGRTVMHAVTAGAAIVAAAGSLVRRPMPAALGSAAWLVLTARFSWERIAPGPKSRAEITTMLITSAVIPLVAIAHRARGFLRLRRLTATGPLMGTAR